MLVSALTFITGLVVGPAVLLFIANRMKKPAHMPAKEVPTRDQLIKALEHLRDRMRTIEESSDQKVICEIARRAQAHADATLKAPSMPTQNDHTMPDIALYNRLRKRIGDYDDADVARDLLDCMVAKATEEAGYAAELTAWMNDGSTIALRKLAEPFGKYWDDLKYMNAVDTIDSAHLHINDGPLNT
jgi:hypothetical protein